MIFSFQLSAFPCWPDFTTPTRQLTLRQPTDEAETIMDAALRLFAQIWSRGQAVRGKIES
jgi:nucleotidyltransferase/DNA polymerase involved in DNA repair